MPVVYLDARNSTPAGRMSRHSAPGPIDNRFGDAANERVPMQRLAALKAFPCKDKWTGATMDRAWETTQQAARNTANSKKSAQDKTGGRDRWGNAENLRNWIRNRDLTHDLQKRSPRRSSWSWNASAGHDPRLAEAPAAESGKTNNPGRSRQLCTIVPGRAIFFARAMCPATNSVVFLMPGSLGIRWRFDAMLRRPGDSLLCCKATAMAPALLRILAAAGVVHARKRPTISLLLGKLGNWKADNCRQVGSEGQHGTRTVPQM
jgi:hypothetical protein